MKMINFSLPALTAKRSKFAFDDSLFSAPTTNGFVGLGLCPKLEVAKLNDRAKITIEVIN